MIGLKKKRPESHWNWQKVCIKGKQKRRRYISLSGSHAWVLFWTDDIHPPSQPRHLTNPKEDNQEGTHTWIGDGAVAGHRNKENALTVAGETTWAGERTGEPLRSDWQRRQPEHSGSGLAARPETPAGAPQLQTRGKPLLGKRGKQAQFTQQRGSFCYRYNLMKDISKERTWGKRKVPDGKSEVKEKKQTTKFKWRSPIQSNRNRL